MGSVKNGSNLIEVRPAAIEDSNAIFNLANQLHAAVSVAKSDFDSTYAVVLQRRESLCLVATVSSTIVGYIAASIRPVLFQGGYSAYVDEIVVSNDSRGQGVGCTLMENMEGWARVQNCGLVGLATGGAGVFYEKLGYESRAGYYKKNL